MILGYVCFVLPSFLLSLSWKGRLLTAALCAIGLLPAVLLAVALMAVGDLWGWAGSVPLGLLFGVGVAYSLYKAERVPMPPSARHGVGSLRPLGAVMTSVFVWAVYAQALLDTLGLGVRPPEPSWGTMLMAQSASWWPNVIASLGLAIIGLTAFATGDLLSRPAKRRAAASAPG